MVNWNWSNKRFSNIVTKNGVWLQWLHRVTSGSTAYDTGSTTTYGYGDPIVYWVTGSVKAVMEHVSAKDIVLEAGFYAEDYERIYVGTSETIDYWEQVIYPSGSGVRYLVLPLHIWRMTVGDTIVSKSAMIRRLVPKGSSTY